MFILIINNFINKKLLFTKIIYKIIRLMYSISYLKILFIFNGFNLIHIAHLVHEELLNNI